MYQQLFVNLLPLLVPIGDGSAPSPTVADTADVAQNIAANPVGDWTNIIFIVIFLGLIVYMLFIQPRRAQKKKDAMLNSIGAGDTILTSSGFYGRVAEVGSDSYVIEFGDSKIVRVPVRKEAIDSKREPNSAKAEITERK
jgi:preprotein translocase subunit YajC